MRSDLGKRCAPPNPCDTDLTRPLSEQGDRPDPLFDPTAPRLARELTPQELQVVAALAEACTYAEIGARLGKSAGTAKSLVMRIYRHTGIHDRAQLVVWALRTERIRWRRGRVVPTDPTDRVFYAHGRALWRDEALELAALLVGADPVEQRLLLRDLWGPPATGEQAGAA